MAPKQEDIRGQLRGGREQGEKQLAAPLLAEQDSIVQELKTIPCSKDRLNRAVIWCEGPRDGHGNC